jgi:rfaE bifunctional protein nucleotidyltransferase chain/domain
MNKRTIQSKITTREVLAPLVAQWRSEGKIVGFTSGSFDIIHAGHVSYLEKAKGRCDLLIAAINSDASVQSYKGPDRPIVPQDARVKMMASLESIDYVYTFEERRNRQNLEVIKPSYYIKAGDYTPEQLTSADVVKQYGGDVMILPMEGTFSTTNMVKKILKVYGEKDEEKKDGQDEAASAIKSSTEKRDPQKAVFLDRDGTINVEIHYLHEPEKFQLEKNVGEGIKKFQDMGYKIVVVTTQAGIGLGYFTKEDFFKCNSALFKHLKPYDVIVDKIYFATHSKTPDGKNTKDALFERAREELDLDFKQCIMIGDKTGDIDVGKRFGCKAIGVKTGHACQDGRYDIQPDYLAEDLLDAARFVEQDLRGKEE